MSAIIELKYNYKSFTKADLGNISMLKSFQDLINKSNDEMKMINTTFWSFFFQDFFKNKLEKKAFLNQIV